MPFLFDLSGISRILCTLVRQHLGQAPDKEKIKLKATLKGNDYKKTWVCVRLLNLDQARATMATRKTTAKTATIT